MVNTLKNEVPKKKHTKSIRNINKKDTPLNRAIYAWNWQAAVVYIIFFVVLKEKRLYSIFIWSIVWYGRIFYSL